MFNNIQIIAYHYSGMLTMLIRVLMFLLVIPSRVSSCENQEVKSLSFMTGECVFWGLGLFALGLFSWGVYKSLYKGAQDSDSDSDSDSDLGPYTRPDEGVLESKSSAEDYDIARAQLEMERGELPHPDLEDVSNPTLGPLEGFTRLHVEPYHLDPVLRIRDPLNVPAYWYDPVHIRLIQSYRAWDRLKQGFKVEDRYDLDELREIIAEKKKVESAIKQFRQHYNSRETENYMLGSMDMDMSMEPIYKHKVGEILRHGSCTEKGIISSLIDGKRTYTEVYVEYNVRCNEIYPDPSIRVRELNILEQLYYYWFSGGGSGGEGSGLFYEIGS